jgi:hypothetical protein
METKTGVAELQRLHLSFATFLTDSFNQSNMSDGEREFIGTILNTPNLVKVGNTDYEFLRKDVHEKIDRILTSYDKVFIETGMSDLFEHLKGTKEFQDMLIQLRKTKSLVATFKYVGLFLVGQTLLFFVRVTKTAIYLYKVADEIYDTNTVVSKKESITKGMGRIFQYIDIFLNHVPKAEEEIYSSNNDVIEDKSLINAQKQTIETLSNRIEELDLLLDDKRLKQKQESLGNEVKDLVREMRGNMSNLVDVAKKLLDLFAEFSKKLSAPSNGTKEEEQQKSDISQMIKNNSVSLSSLNISLNNVTNILTVFGAKDSPSKVNEIAFTDYNVIIHTLIRIQDLYELLGNETQSTTLLSSKPTNVLQEIKEKKATLYASSDLYRELLTLYESMSGTVRVIVKVRETNPSITMGGKLMKKRYYKVHYGGANMSTYRVRLDSSRNLVYFDGVLHIHEVFYNQIGTNSGYNKDPKPTLDKSSYSFGPFYKVHSQSYKTDDIVSNSLDFNNLVNVFNVKSSSVVFYTYGYSGSGKTYTLFGKKDTISDGVVWSLLKRLSERGFDVQLVKRIKCYGTLSSIDKSDSVSFVDEVTEEISSPNNNADILGRISAWMKTIGTDLQMQTNTASFLKRTSNNPESSRGFYILKFSVTSKDTNITSYIGVVDMAGNEDPFDIATSMCPTLDFEKTDRLIREPQMFTEFDYIYNNISNVVTETVLSVVMKLTFLLQHGSIPPSQMAHNIPLYKSLETMRTKIEEIAKNPGTIKKRLQPSITSNIISKTDFKIQKGSSSIFEKYLVLDEKMAIAYVKDKDTFEVVCYLSDNLIRDILLDVRAKVSQNNDFSNIKSVTLSYIKELLMQSKKIGDNSMFKYALLTYVIENQNNLKFDKKHVSVIISNNDLVDNISRKKVQTSDNEINDFIKNQARLLIKERVKMNFDQENYMFPVAKDDDNNDVFYKYDIISQIIKEGYYINKANAELIHYFGKKRKLENVKYLDKYKIGIASRYNFNTQFSLQNYKKFSKDFQPIKDLPKEFETNLVPIIYNEFNMNGINAKDIMFSCIRNDNELGKALGAIDTLLLVQDLKST